MHSKVPICPAVMVPRIASPWMVPEKLASTPWTDTRKLSWLPAIFPSAMSPLPTWDVRDPVTTSPCCCRFRVKAMGPWSVATSIDHEPDAGAAVATGAPASGSEPVPLP